jgi:hypothetical protein
MNFLRLLRLIILSKKLKYPLIRGLTKLILTFTFIKTKLEKAKPEMLNVK